MFKTVILCLTIGLLLIGKAALAQDQAPAPTYHNGDSWQFSAIEKSPVASSTRALIGRQQSIAACSTHGPRPKGDVGRYRLLIDSNAASA